MREARTLPLLRNLPKEARLFAVLIMTVLGIGYGHALAYVYQTTRVVPKGIEQRYRGTENLLADTSQAAPLSSEEAEDSSKAATTAPEANTVTGEIQYQKSLAEMLNIIHTHILTMTFIFALSGFLTLMTDSISARLRKFVIIEPFIGIIVTFAGLWLMRYVHPAFSWLVSLSGTVMALAFAGECVALFKEVRLSHKGGGTE